MGFKKATQVTYIAHNMEFLSKKEYLNAKFISELLDLLYSSSREDKEEINTILNKVEELIGNFDGNTRLRVGDEDFNPNFVGIINFLYEANHIGTNYEDKETKNLTRAMKRRFVNISDKLREYCDFIEF